MSPRQILHMSLWVKRHMMKQYQVDIARHLRPFVAVDDVCLDIGAHAGAWTRMLSRFARYGHVYAFEALPYYADMLSMMLRLLQHHNVTVINKAVMDKNQTVRIKWKDMTGQRLTGKTHIAGSHDATGEYITVQGVTLDSFCDSVVPRKVGLVKCDIEGAELLALKGAERLFDVHRPIFYGELWTEYCQRYGYQPKDVFRFFQERGYCSYTIEPKAGLRPVIAANYPGRGDVLFTPIS